MNCTREGRERGDGGDRRTRRRWPGKMAAPARGVNGFGGDAEADPASNGNGMGRILFG